MSGFSPQTLHAVGWTLLHFLWQGAALAALFAALLVVIRNANVRYALGIATLVLMIAAPVVTFVQLDRAASPVPTFEMPIAATVPDAISADQAQPSSGRIVDALAAGANRQDMMLWLVQAWFVGVMLLSARTAGGLLWLARARRQIEPLSDELYRQCLELQRRMGLNRNIRYGQCRWLDAPVVLGWFRPIVLVTTQAMTGLSPQQLQAIVAHELAHVRRWDAFVNLLQIAAEMLLFYHPAVWWVSRRIRIEREVCCDHEALAACGEPVSYARALTLMEEWRAAPSLSMAANRGPLAERVVRLLNLQSTSARSRVAGVGVGILGVTAALFAGYVFAAAQVAPEVESPEPPAPVVEPAPAAAPASRAVPAPRPAPKPQAAPAPKQPPRPVAPNEADDATAKNSSSYIQSMAAAGFSDLSVDELIAMRVQGITSAYVQAMRATQLRPDVNHLIAMKVHDVTPEYVDEARRLVEGVDVDRVIAMKVHGVTPEFIREIRASGLDVRKADDFIAAKAMGITPEFIKRAVDHGFRDLTMEKLILLRTVDVI